jgi:cell division septation protein DedD
MTRDFARKKGKPSSAKHASPGPRRSPGGPAPWTWFASGLLCGIFFSALVWLAMQQPDGAVVAEGDSASTNATPTAENPGPRFDFYTLLPEQKIDVDVDPAQIAAAQSSKASEQFLLQAGSFKQPQDADRRRAELLLLGLEAHVEEATGDNGRWYRVYIGPFESRSKLAKARSITAQQGIDTLLLKRPPQKQG